MSTQAFGCSQCSLDCTHFALSQCSTVQTTSPRLHSITGNYIKSNGGKVTCVRDWVKCVLTNRLFLSIPDVHRFGIVRNAFLTIISLFSAELAFWKMPTIRLGVKKSFTFRQNQRKITASQYILGEIADGIKRKFDEVCRTWCCFMLDGWIDRFSRARTIHG